MITFMRLNFRSMNIFFQYTSALIGFLAIASPVLAGGVEITNFSHRALLIKGGGKSLLINPFSAVGCAAGLKEPRVSANIILASSKLADEGSSVAKGKFFVKPGSYRIQGMSIEGFSVDHDRLGGRRFGKATLWKWSQGGLNFAHLGGGAGPLSIENQVLLGRPDVLIIAVGGGAKVYNGLEAAQIVRELNPRYIIPFQYVKGIVPKDCDQNGIEPFLEAMKDVEVRAVGETYSLSNNLQNKMVINILE